MPDPVRSDLLTAYMLREGFAPHAPNEQTSVFDKLEMSMTTCKCGHVGLEYRPFTKYAEEGPKYRFFGVCPSCHQEQEY